MSTFTPSATSNKNNKIVSDLPEIIIRLAGDSGDGMQLIGQEFSHNSALMGNDIGTFPDFPAEIRAPIGTVAGVSGFQLRIGNHRIFTAGDTADVLVAMNPAALSACLSSLKKNGIIIVNSSTFDEKNFRLAEIDGNPLENDSLNGYEVYSLPISDLTTKALLENSLTHREKERCKNFFAMGLLIWLYERNLQAALNGISKKFAKKENLLEANILALKAGYAYGDASEIFKRTFHIGPAQLESGTYRSISGNKALTLGLIAAGHLSGLRPVYCSYPITPASDILHEAAKMREHGIISFQAEDEIAAATAALGASFGGGIGITGTSGPGLNLKMEAINLGVISELPMVIIDVQRAGPSTGMPTKTEQSDLLASLYGRNGESPLVVLAASSPIDCFYRAIEAVRLAAEFLTPVILLSEGAIANGNEPWKIPNLQSLAKIHPAFTTSSASEYLPYKRSSTTGTRSWAIPGMKGFEHRIGGLSKADGSGTVSYDPYNHDLMMRSRHNKIAGIANFLPPLTVNGCQSGNLLVLGWGGTYGSIRTACEKIAKTNNFLGWAHLHHLNPLPKNIGEVLSNFKTILVPEVNLGQLNLVLASRFQLPIKSYAHVHGRPLSIESVTKAINKYLK